MKVILLENCEPSQRLVLIHSMCVVCMYSTHLQEDRCMGQGCRGRSRNIDRGVLF